jgi:hypothetical protein
MADEKNHIETLSGRVPQGLPAEFRGTVPRGFKIGHCLAAAARLWIDLPEETRLQLLTGQFKNSLVEVVRQIVEERIAAGEAAGRALAARQKRRPDRKD